jgi:serine protease Do
MNKWVITLVLVVLTVFSVTNGVLYFQAASALDDSEQRVTTLEGQLSSLNNNLSTLSTDYTALEGELAIAESDILALEDNISSLQSDSCAVTDTISLVKDTVVYIEVESRRGFSSGSGVIFTTDGYLLTNSHVIEGYQDIRVFLEDGRDFGASVVADDPLLDLAILILNSTLDNFPAATLGNYETIIIGDDVLALGFPYPDGIGYELSVTAGIISSLRFIDGYHYIQTDAAINPGNSGGPLVNTGGEMIGINSWTYYDYYNDESADNIGFAIAVNEMRQFIEENIGAID